MPTGSSLITVTSPPSSRRIHAGELERQDPNETDDLPEPARVQYTIDQQLEPMVANADQARNRRSKVKIQKSTMETVDILKNQKDRKNRLKSDDRMR